MTITAKVICDSICKQSGWNQFRHLIKDESVPG